MQYGFQCCAPEGCALSFQTIITSYLGMSVTTVAEEKEFNPRLTHSLEEFIFIMETLGLAAPRKMGKNK